MKTPFHMAGNERPFDVVELTPLETLLGINLIAQHVNGKTRFDVWPYFLISKFKITTLSCVIYFP